MKLHTLILLFATATIAAPAGRWIGSLFQGIRGTEQAQRLTEDSYTDLKTSLEKAHELSESYNRALESLKDDHQIEFTVESSADFPDRFPTLSTEDPERLGSVSLGSERPGSQSLGSLDLS